MIEQTPAPQVRAFVAVELPATVIALLVAMQDALRAASLAVRYPAPAGLHLTLSFLGEIPATAVPPLIAAVQQGCAGLAPFDLRAEGLGMFPHARAPRVVWVGVGGAPEAMSALTALQHGIAAAISRAGLPVDRRFDPHLTLARVLDRASAAERARAGAAVQALPPRPPAPFHVDTVSVMRSDLRAGGSVYTRLAAVRLDAAG